MLRAASQDVVTPTSGAARVRDRAALTVWLDGRLTTRWLAADPPAPLEALVGIPAGRGFRAAVRQAPVPVAGPLGLLLDDVPVAALISGYATLRSGGFGTGGAARPGSLAAMRDLCSGWRDGGTMMSSIDRGDGVPVPALVPAPSIDLPDDELSGDPPESLPSGSLRRRRRIDVLRTEGDGTTPIRAMFRDTFAGEDGAEGILHEYALEASVDADGVLLTIDADPRVLPWPECPAAAAVVGGLVGRHLSELARALPEGTASCTHLNDLLRSLAGAEGLLIHAGQT